MKDVWKKSAYFSGNIDRVIWRLPERIKGKQEKQRQSKKKSW